MTLRRFSDLGEDDVGFVFLVFENQEGNLPTFNTANRMFTVVNHGPTKIREFYLDGTVSDAKLADAGFNNRVIVKLGGTIPDLGPKMRELIPALGPASSGSAALGPAPQADAPIEPRKKKKRGGGKKKLLKKTKKIIFSNSIMVSKTKRRSRSGAGRKKRAMTRSRTTKRKSKVYRNRVKRNSSGCRGKKSTACRKKTGCKVAKGKKRSFCRRSGKNRKA
uniref:Uncharacterized protein n=1 Tax=viral metagenome TaxID=1070528 RepID=A0A6C0JCA3_9ZZZZ